MIHFARRDAQSNKKYGIPIATCSLPICDAFSPRGRSNDPLEQAVDRSHSALKRGQFRNQFPWELKTCVPWSKVAILGMVIPRLIGILFMGIKTPTIGLMTIPYYIVALKTCPGATKKIANLHILHILTGHPPHDIHPPCDAPPVRLGTSGCGSDTKGPQSKRLLCSRHQSNKMPMG